MKQNNNELDQLLQQVDKVNLMHNVAEISQYIRTPASIDEQKAFAYIQKTLTTLGLEVQLIYRHAYISVPTSASLTIDNRLISCITHAMLPSANISNSELIYIAAANLSQQPTIDLQNKIIVTEGLPTYPILKTAETNNAAAMIFISGPQPHEMIVSKVWGSPTPEKMDQFLKIPAISISQTDGELLKVHLRESRPSLGKIKTEVKTSWLNIPILTATLKSNISDTYLLLSGHVDSWHNGAMDNASGNSASIEIARILSKQRDKLQRSIKFVFWSGHSHGRYAGSAAFCDAYFQDLQDYCFLHVNIDCLGGKGATLLTQAACMPETKQLGAAAIKKVTGEILEGVDFCRSSDQSFWGTGTPSLFAGVSEQPPPQEKDAAAKAFALLFGGAKSGGFGWWWHTPADTIERIDPEFLQRDCQIYLATVYKACTEKIIPLKISAAIANFSLLLHNYPQQTVDFSAIFSILEEIHKKTVYIEQQDCTQQNPRFFYIYNQWIISIEQIFVPLTYVCGNIFDHDSALRQPSLPSLPRIYDNNPNFTIILQRKYNHILNHLIHALNITDKFFYQLKQIVNN